MRSSASAARPTRHPDASLDLWRDARRRKQIRRPPIGLHGTVDRVQYEGGALSTDDYTDYGLKLRASYRLSEAVSPFAELGGDMRDYDEPSTPPATTAPPTA